MPQLGLFLRHRLSYSPHNFVLHTGVKDVVDSVLSAVESTSSFSFSIINGDSRSGKTHLLIHLIQKFLDAKRLPSLYDGMEFVQIIEEQGRKTDPLPQRSIFLIDDCYDYFFGLKKGDSGAFINFYEKVQCSDSSLIFTSSGNLKTLPCGDDIQSRFSFAHCFALGRPMETDMPELVLSFAEQRGVKLKSAQVQFIAKRIGNDIVECENFFNRVVHLSQVSGKKLKYELFEELLG